LDIGEHFYHRIKKKYVYHPHLSRIIVVIMDLVIIKILNQIGGVKE